MKRVLLAAMMLAAIACAKPIERPIEPKTLTKITLNVNPVFSYAPIMIAKEEGFFEDQGIDAELVSLDSNSAVAAAAAGKLDVLSAGIRSGVFNMMLKGVPMQIVADKGHSDAGPCTSEAFVAPVALAEKIAAKGGSLRGERVALTRGGTIEFLMIKLLEHQKLTPDDVIVVQLPQGTAASSRNKVDAVRFVGEPNLSSILAEGWGRIVAKPEDVAPGHQTAVLIFGKRLLKDDPDLGRRVMRAYLRGVRRYNEGKTERNIAILAKHTKLPPEIIRNTCWLAFADHGRIDPRAVQPFLDWALEKRYIDAPVPLTTWWNPAFVDMANESLTVSPR